MKVKLNLEKITLHEHHRYDHHVSELLEQAHLCSEDFYLVRNVFDLFDLKKESIEIFNPHKIFENIIRQSYPNENKAIVCQPGEGIYEFIDWPGYYYMQYMTQTPTGMQEIQILLIPVKSCSKEKFIEYVIKKVALFQEIGRTKNKKEESNYMDRTFLDVNVKENIIEKIKMFLENKKFYDDHHLPWKLGILLYGPPGNGKTLLIKALSEYFSFPVNDLSNYISNGKIIINEVTKSGMPARIINPYQCYKFVYGEEILPTVYYLEDIDKKVYNQGRDMPILPINELLQTLDGVNEVKDIIIIATTNYLKDLISALVARPGRFDIVQELKQPGPKQIEQMLNYYKFKINDFSLEKFYQRFGGSGSSMAFVENFIKTCILTHKKTEFVFKEIENIHNEILNHIKLEKEFKDSGGFGFS